MTFKEDTKSPANHNLEFENSIAKYRNYFIPPSLFSVYPLYNLYFPLQLHGMQASKSPLNPVLCDAVDCQVQKRKKAEGDRKDRA